jgi:hypothetical protein
MNPATLLQEGLRATIRLTACRLLILGFAGGLAAQTPENASGDGPVAVLGYSDAMERITGNFRTSLKQGKLLVMENHPLTPWAYRAGEELNRGYGIELFEDHDPKRMPRFVPFN